MIEAERDRQVSEIEDTPQRLVQERIKAINALVDKLAKAEAKVEQYQIAIGQHIAAIKAARPDDWLEIVRDQCDLGRSRAYDLLNIADGTKTVAETNAGAAKRMRDMRKRKADAEEPVRNVTDSAPGTAMVTEAKPVVEADDDDNDENDYSERYDADELRGILISAAGRAERLAWEAIEACKGLPGSMDAEIEKAVSRALRAWGAVSNTVRGFVPVPKLNALGKPLNPKHDPNHKMKYRTPKLKGKPAAIKLSPDQWGEMSTEAKAEWKRWAAERVATSS